MISDVVERSNEATTFADGVPQVRRRMRGKSLSTIAILGVGPYLELHSTPAFVEVPAQDADIRGIGTDHLAHIEGVRLWQPVQYRDRHEARAIAYGDGWRSVRRETLTHA